MPSNKILFTYLRGLHWHVNSEQMAENPEPSLVSVALLTPLSLTPWLILASRLLLLDIWQRMTANSLSTTLSLERHFSIHFFLVRFSSLTSYVSSSSSSSPRLPSIIFCSFTPGLEYTVCKRSQRRTQRQVPTWPAAVRPVAERLMFSRRQ